jgi:uncharacterized protein YjdB
MISAVAPGAAVLSAVSEGISGQATLSIAPPSPTPIATLSVAVNPSTVQVGQTAHAVATLKDSTGNPLSGRTVVWASSNASIATVDATGLVTGMASGSSTISASSEG